MTTSTLRGSLEMLTTLTVSLAIQAGFYAACVSSLVR
jgi:hypothetical protein